MQRHRLVLPAVAAALAFAAAGLPAAASAASWGPALDATRSGRSFDPALATDVEGRFAIGFVRQLNGANRMEVRTGTVRDRLRGDSVLLDSSRGNVDSPAVTFVPANGPLGVAWRRLSDHAQRLRGATVPRTGDVAGPYDLTTDGTSSAYDPRWVSRPNDPPLLVWDRRTSSAEAPLQGDAFGAATGLPGTGVAAQLSLAVQSDGSQLAVWVTGGRVFAALSPAVGQPFGAALTLSAPGTARSPQLTIGGDGTALVAWVRTTGAGNVMEVTTRPPGGTFNTPVALSPPTEGAFAPAVAPSGSAGFLASWVAGRTGPGFGGGSGPLRVLRLAAEGSPTGPITTLTPSGAKVSGATLAADGLGGVLLGWRVGVGSARQVVARRVAGNGVVGAPRTLDAGARIESGTPDIAAAGGRAVASWIAGGIIRYRLYR